METTISIDHLINEIEKLDYRDKINLMSRIVNLLKREENYAQATSVLELKGLGKNIWQSNEVASYVLAERQSWD